MNKKAITLIKEFSLIALSFFIPFIILIIIFNNNHIALNGYNNLTTAMIDMQSQYICYMRDFREILIHGESLIYTTEKVFGGDYMSLFTFYLSSPFNLFVVFFKEETIPLFFVWSSLLKMSFAGLNCYLFLRFTSKFNYSKIIFSLGYALTSYSLIYISNFMWLDGVMILPLVALGIHFLKDKKHYWLYPLAIAYSLMTSWYIGFMICIFAVLYFLYLFASTFSLKDKEFIGFAIRFAVFSLVGGLLSITYWLVAFMHLSGTKGFSELPKSRWFSISSLLSGFLENNYSQTDLIRQYNSYISMFVGVVPLVFAITFFCNKKYSYVERLALFFLIAFYLFMSSNTMTAALLHGGKEPTWFPGRYSFIISLLVCYLGSKSMDEAHELHPLWYLVPTAIGIGALFILAKVKHSERLALYPISVPSAIMYFVVILFASGISLFNLLNKLPEESKIKSLIPHALSLLLVVQIISVYRGSNKVIETNVKDNQYQQYEKYLEDTSYSPYFKAIKNYEKENGNQPFYRMESTFNRPGNYNSIDNNPMFYSYSGLSNFSSSGKKEVESYMPRLGFHYNGFFAKYQAGSTYSINSFLGIKYLLEDRNARYNIHPYFLDYNTFEKVNLFEDGNMKFYKNNNAFSLGFSSDKAGNFFVNEGVRAASGNVYWFDHFEYQNQIFKDIDRSIDENIFRPLTQTSFYTNVDYTEDEFGIKTYKNALASNLITIKFQVPEEGYGMPLYFAEKEYQSDITYYIDGKRMEINTYWNKGIYSFPDNTSHTHTLQMYFQKAKDQITIRPELYYEYLPSANKYFAAAKTQEFKLEKIQSGVGKKSYVGHIDIVNNNKDLVFTLPNEKGINVYVDGKKAETYTRYNIFTAIDLSKYENVNHKVVIEYKDTTFRVALPIFIVTALGFVPLVLFYDKIGKVFHKKEEKDK